MCRTAQLSPTRVSLERALRRSGGWVMALSWLVERTTTRAGFDALVDRLSGAHPDFVAWFDELLSAALPLEERELMLQLGVLERFFPRAYGPPAGRGALDPAPGSL